MAQTELDERIRLEIKDYRKKLKTIYLIVLISIISISCIFLSYYKSKQVPLFPENVLYTRPLSTTIPFTYLMFTVFLVIFSSALFGLKVRWYIPPTLFSYVSNELKLLGLKELEKRRNNIQTLIDGIILKMYFYDEIKESSEENMLKIEAIPIMKIANMNEIAKRNLLCYNSLKGCFETWVDLETFPLKMLAILKLIKETEKCVTS